jgi:hypothetical protein
MLHASKSKTKDTFDCDICYNERPTDIMVKLCNETKIKVCNCNISICRKCADKMQQKSCPTCRKTFNQFVYTDEVSDSKLLTLSKQPSFLTLQHSCKLSIAQDKPIMLDYWINSLNKSACIGVKTSGEKLLVKSPEEYTSTITKLFKSEKDFIIITSNSIYIVSSDISVKRVS